MGHFIPGLEEAVGKLTGDKSTEKLISAEIIHALGSDGVLINISRGNVIDEQALITALKSGALGGAGLDVFVEEPAPVERWKDVPNCTLTPHLGGGTREAIRDYQRTAGLPPDGYASDVLLQYLRSE